MEMELEMESLDGEQQDDEVRMEVAAMGAEYEEAVMRGEADTYEGLRESRAQKVMRYVPFLRKTLPNNRNVGWGLNGDWALLPHDMKTLIFDRLSLEDFARMSQTCKAWHNASKKHPHYELSQAAAATTLEARAMAESVAARKKVLQAQARRHRCRRCCSKFGSCLGAAFCEKGCLIAAAIFLLIGWVTAGAVLLWAPFPPFGVPQNIELETLRNQWAPGMCTVHSWQRQVWFCNDFGECPNSDSCASNRIASRWIYRVTVDSSNFLEPRIDVTAVDTIAAIYLDCDLEPRIKGASSEPLFAQQGPQPCLVPLTATSYSSVNRTNPTYGQELPVLALSYSNVTEWEEYESKRNAGLGLFISFWFVAVGLCICVTG